MPRPGLDLIADRDTPDPPGAPSSTVDGPRDRRATIGFAVVALLLVPFTDG